MSLTSCEDILGEWSRPTPVTPTVNPDVTPEPPANPMLATPLTLEVTTAGTIVVDNPKPGMQYSLNGGAKTDVPNGGAINNSDLNVGDKVEFYGTASSYYNTNIKGGSAEVKVYGNIMSLLYEDFATNYTTLPADDTFASLFKDNAKLTDASGLLLPATTLRAFCYWGMFSGCTGLTTVPEKLLPATDLKDGCYLNMFLNCTGLTTAPELPATTLTNSCYGGMFSGCSKLIATPHLAAPTSELVGGCYQGMFKNCTILKKAYVKAGYKNTVGIYECDDMFTGCSASGDLYTDGAISGTPSWAGASVVSAWTKHAYE